MNIKDFSVGQIVFCLVNDGRGNSRAESYYVAKVGRKYLTLFRPNRDYKFESLDHFPEGLVEVKDYGTRDLLFPSEQSLNDFVEKKKLEKWLIDAARKHYTLDQLRAVKKILEG